MECFSNQLILHCNLYLTSFNIYIYIFAKFKKLFTDKLEDDFRI